MRRNEFKRKKESITLKEAINDLMNTYKIDRKFKEAQLIASWEQIMGATISNRTKKIFVGNEVLYVTLSSAALKQELSMSKEKVIRLINEKFGQQIIKDVVFY